VDRTRDFTANYVNVMDQYAPDGMVVRQPQKYSVLNRGVTAAEHEQALRLAQIAGLERNDRRQPHPLLKSRASPVNCRRWLRPLLTDEALPVKQKRPFNRPMLRCRRGAKGIAWRHGPKLKSKAQSLTAYHRRMPVL